MLTPKISCNAKPDPWVQVHTNIKPRQPSRQIFLFSPWDGFFSVIVLLMNSVLLSKRGQIAREYNKRKLHRSPLLQSWRDHTRKNTSVVMTINKLTSGRHTECACHGASIWKGTNFLKTASDRVCGQRLTQFRSQWKSAVYYYGHGGRARKEDQIDSCQ